MMGRIFCLRISSMKAPEAEIRDLEDASIAILILGDVLKPDDVLRFDVAVSAEELFSGRDLQFDVFLWCTYFALDDERVRNPEVMYCVESGCDSSHLFK